VLGARCTDVLSGLGPAPLAAGQRLPVGRGVTRQPVADLAPQPAHNARPTLRVLPGPRQDWFTPDALDVLCAAPYEVSADSNRVGIRLRGAELRRRINDELPPEAMVAGALQVPPSGQPVLFLADHPTTGGYPVIGVVVDDDLHFAAQARPGQHLTFRLA
jgi:allophanate hydrolase subunit 2